MRTTSVKAQLFKLGRNFIASFRDFFISKRIHLKSLAFCLLILLPLQQGFAAEKKTILFINPGYENQGFWKAVSDTMRAAANHLGFKLEIVSANRGWPAMVYHGKIAMDEVKPDYLILVNEQQQAPKLLEHADKLQIPSLLLLNTLTPTQIEKYGAARGHFKYWLGSIVPDNRKAGYEMLTGLAQKLQQMGYDFNNDNSKFIPLLSFAGDVKTPASLQRLEGLDHGLARYPQLNEIRRINANWSADTAYERTKLFLKSQGELKAIWAANDPIAIGAMQALREMQIIPGRDVVVAGLNWSPEAVDLVERGDMVMTHGGHFLAGAWSIVMLYDYDKG